MIPDFDLPAITTPEPPLPLVSSADNLRWRLSNHVWRKPLRQEPPQGEPFVWIESAPLPLKSQPG